MRASHVLPGAPASLGETAELFSGRDPQGTECGVNGWTVYGQAGDRVEVRTCSLVAEVRGKTGIRPLVFAMSSASLGEYRTALGLSFPDCEMQGR